MLLVTKHPRTPWYAKVWLAGVVAYALSPIDLIPDFIPVFGYLDDLILLPLGIWIGMKLVPADVVAECRNRAAQAACQPKKRSFLAALIIVTIWLLAVIAAAYLAKWFYRSHIIGT